MPFALGAPVTATVTQALDLQRPVGAAVGIVKDGQLIYVRAYGMRNVAASEPVDADTRFEIASITKQFAAASILQLQEAGKLSIDDKLSNYFPSFPHAGEITLRQLLYQVTGLRDYMGALSAKGVAEGGSLSEVASLVDGPLHFEPGTNWEYSNTNYYLLGKVVEAVSGQSFESYVRAHLFAPAGMTHSGFLDDESSISDVAVGYWNGEHHNLPVQRTPPFREAWAGGAAGIVSTVGDLAAWDDALTSGKIVSLADYALMSTPLKPDGTSDGYGMGLAIVPLDGHEQIKHDGSALGSVAVDAMFPKDRLDIIVLENSSWGDPDAVETDVLESMYPDAAMAAAPGEDPAMRSQILRILNDVMSGALPNDDITPSFAKVATPSALKRMAAQFAPLGPPAAVIYKGKSETPRDVVYRYRVAFRSNAITFAISIDKKTKRVDGITLT